MDTAVLVAPDIEIGKQVLRYLEDAGISVDMLLWAVLEQYGDWRLLLASSSFRDEDRRDAYARLNDALHGKFPFHSPTVTILKNSDTFITEVRKYIAGVPDTFALRLGSQMFGQKYLLDAFVYRIR